jgi:branched-chain amino acid transport system substrate-binding protein
MTARHFYEITSVAALIALVALGSPKSAIADATVIPVLAPTTGFLALEGGAQRNGALLAAEHATANGFPVSADVQDTTTAPDVAISAFRRALRHTVPPAMMGPILGSQMLALLSLADREGLPLLTISGTAKLTQMGSPNIFRYFPGDVVVKAAHARYAAEDLGMKRPAILYQTTAYGQSGRAELVRNLKVLGIAPVYEEGLSPAAKDISAALAKAAAAGADGLLLHLHAGPTALTIRQAREAGMRLPVVAGSAMHQPTTAALLPPEMLAGVCAESGSAPAAETKGPGKAFADAYRARFSQEPDAFALAEYDAFSMLVAAMRNGAKTPADVRTALSRMQYPGIAMTYQSNGRGDMAHSAVIVCYDGKSHRATITKRYGATPAAH